ncbi:electron transfer flavoprotein subunit alpha/FixB family protein [Vallitalea pronyensis]|uniref:Electron transfer flavoprotein subunit alpha/FixB family protein n=1 Tax=Vallitalea pronyensis TaxID=1348613 RepID=A0A8J8MN45_9FIRM|nr:electron transfer flavoprotein subunit alpha/FixB family protein [Vallitalea pronyensis]QUI24303.1 electron transfer flavoprotein subunit alpha/FixB family protein [Vallitalea pronyensis]
MSNAKVNQIKDMTDYQGVCIVAHQEKGVNLPISFELINEGKKLAEKTASHLHVVILGHTINEAVEELSYYGADKIYYYDHPLLDTYTTDAYTKVISTFIQNIKPEIVIFGASSIGRDFAPRVAARVGTGLVADCTRLDINEDCKFLQTRPAFGGNLMATIICPNDRPQMATVRPGVMEKAEPIEESSEIIKIVPELTEEDIIAKTIEIIMDKTKKVSLTNTEIIVSGGRGVGNAEGFSLLEELADVLGGVVGASRVPVDSGWISHSRQIGQTGQTVRPKLYIACGISGAIQHMTGMSESDYIIAINKNPKAPIMKQAHLAIEGDLYKVIPELIQEIKVKKGLA